MVDISSETIQRSINECEGYCEWLLQLLGADSIESFDASNFEGSTQTHDFNIAIPDRYKNSYSAVFDGGTLEHVFNYPVALKSCMEMITEGGHFLSITPANNYSGHGFYQFSPELFFRAFSEENGFEIVEVVLIEDRRESPWYRLTDPARISRRVTFENSTPALLLVVARRTLVKPIFESFPQQSDYVTAWETGASDNEASGTPSKLISRLPRAFFRRFRRLVGTRKPRIDQGCFVQFEPFTALTSSRRTP